MARNLTLVRSALLLLLFAGLPLAAQDRQGLSPAQQNQIKRGYGMFIHFGLNTFNETEWSDGTLPVNSYNPDQLDCDQWVKTAREAGFRYVILVTKHHDGFCLWDSKYTGYDVGASPVKTDIVGEVAKACKKYGLELGLYYSLWDRHEPSHNSSDPQDYVDYMKNQLSELLSNYGAITEIWFDGAWAKKTAEWHVEEIYNHIKKLQPDCLVTVNHTIGKRDNINAIGQPKDFQEGDPIRFFPVDFRTKDPNLARWDDPKWYRYGNKDYRLIFEHTLCLSDYWNWFQKKAKIPARSVDELEELFYWCTANDNILIINIPPDEHGLLREHERVRILELADRLGIRNQSGPLPHGYKNISFLKPVKATSADSIFIAANAVDYSLETWWKASVDTATIEIDLGPATNIDRITIFEKGVERSLPDGFTTLVDFFIRKFTLEWYDGKWKTIYQGEGIGRCKIIKLPEPLSGSKLRLRILASDQPPGICHIGVASSQISKIMGFRLDPIGISGFSDSARQVPVSQSVLSDPDHFVWGGSVVKGDDGRYHMFFSYFDAGKNLPVFSDSWLLSSKIGYARSDYPDHGFRFIKMVLGGAAADGNPGAWDAQGVHNPHIKKFNGKYYLYYIGSRDPGERPPGDPGAGLGKRDRIQQVQTVSVIAVDHLEDLINGNFKRPESPLMAARTRVRPNPVIDPSPPGTVALPDNLIMVNPTVVYRPSDKKYLMYFKGNLYDSGWRGVHGVAIADDPAGPFHQQDDFMFSLRTPDGKLASAEDPYVWYHPGTELFYAVFKDFQGHFTGAAPGLAVMISPDGIHWRMHPERIFTPRELPLSDGSSIPLANMERPQFLIDDNGEPLAFYCACSIGPCGPKTDGSTFNAQFAIKIHYIPRNQVSALD